MISGYFYNGYFRNGHFRNWYFMPVVVVTVVVIPPGGGTGGSSAPSSRGTPGVKYFDTRRKQISILEEDEEDLELVSVLASWLNIKD